MTIDRYELALALVGLVALFAAWVPAYTDSRPLSLPILLVLVGWAIGALGFGFTPADPRLHLALTERVTELGVIVSLMGAGLKIDRPFGWRSWSTTWRMVVVAMPITIGLIALMGVAGLGLGVASALLIGAVLAPTDPVLASDVQVGEPTLGEELQDAPPEDDVRFTLTSEAGLNDALAFPFVYGAIILARGNPSIGDALGWVAWDVLGRVAIGCAVGLVVGRLIGVVAFRPPGRLTALAESPQGFIALAATFIAYGSAELLGAYGFLAVFVAAVALRSTERHHSFHADLHGFVEQTENLLVVGLLLVLGASLSVGVLRGLNWRSVAMVASIVVVVRPLSGRVALIGSRLSKTERRAVSFFGIRGIGSIYYLAYALRAVKWPEERLLWAIVTLTLIVSIVVHGITAAPAMQTVDREARRRRWFRRE